MSLSVIPLTILGQITGVSGSGDTVLYQVSFKSIDGTPLYGVTAVWTDEQAEIEALAAQKPYGVWINPIDGTFTVKFAGYTYVGSADLTDDDVLAGVTPIEFMTTEVSDKLLPDVTAADNGKMLQVVDGEWEVKNYPDYIDGDEEIQNTSFSELISTAFLSAATGGQSDFNVSLTSVPEIFQSVCRQAYKGTRRIKGTLLMSAGVFSYKAAYDSIIESVLVEDPNPIENPPDDSFPQTYVSFNIILNGALIGTIIATVIVTEAKGQATSVSSGSIVGHIYPAGD